MSHSAAPTDERLSRHEFLTLLHERLRPRTYLEVGVSTGRSLALSSVPRVGVDPAYRIETELEGDVTLARTTSDEYFATTDPKDRLGGPVELAFIDGMHVFEYALRDFVNVEKHCRWSSVVVFDDMLPRNVDEAARDRHTLAWTGDVFWVAEVLRRYRPDLTVLPVDTVPTGVVVVLGADPSSTVLQDHYQEILDQYVHDDPQPVPDAILRRQDAWDARTLIRRPVWGLLHRGDRPWRRRERGLAEIQEALHQPDDYRRRRRAAREKAQHVVRNVRAGRVRPGTTPVAPAETPADTAQSLLAATTQAGLEAPRRIALLARGRRPALAREIRALRPGIKVVQVDARARAADVRLALASAGRLDAVVDLTPDRDGRAARARELLPHVRKGGVLVLPDAAGGDGVDVRTIPTLARVGVHGTHLWLRACHNAAEVESFFAERGFEVLFPEDYPIAEQAQLFRFARDVAGFGGSAMFNVAFATEPARVCLISAETYSPQNEAMIAAANGHRLTMVWCHADVPHGSGTGVDSRMHTPFTFDFDREGAFLKRVLDEPLPA
ncbi:class I SAM-dependent methyltransferase [Isoptericola sp. NPDC057391]|uniref:class I SAM-dependent methyltransferase n=1 Tax=Isoptericola sp. NPDC057391 TaxID=3346117 RepID=UPI0036322562